MRLTAPLSAALLALTALATPLAAQDIAENEAAKVFSGRWMQSKTPEQNGMLMYLTQERAARGEYLSIRCEADGSRSLRLSFPDLLPAVRGETGETGYVAQARFTVDDKAGGYLLDYTGSTEDPAIFKGTFFNYRMAFATPQDKATFLAALQRGAQLIVQGQALPVDLTGAGQAIAEQAGYCG